jgi:hypothetical protein
MQRNRIKELSRVAVLGTLLGAAALGGCGTFSPSRAPIDCNVVKDQVSAGKTDAQIAGDLTAASNDPGMQNQPVTVAEVAACHGPETTGNKTSGSVPAPY